MNIAMQYEVLVHPRHGGNLCIAVYQRYNGLHEAGIYNTRRCAHLATTGNGKGADYGQESVSPSAVHWNIYMNGLP